MIQLHNEPDGKLCSEAVARCNSKNNEFQSTGGESNNLTG